VRFHVSTAVNMKMTALWDIASYILLDVHRHFIALAMNAVRPHSSVICSLPQANCIPRPSVPTDTSLCTRLQHVV
jgi:hypothetical protein